MWGNALMISWIYSPLWHYFWLCYWDSPLSSWSLSYFWPLHSKILVVWSSFSHCSASQQKRDTSWNYSHLEEKEGYLRKNWLYFAFLAPILYTIELIAEVSMSFSRLRLDSLDPTWNFLFEFCRSRFPLGCFDPDDWFLDLLTFLKLLPKDLWEPLLFLVRLFSLFPAGFPWGNIPSCHVFQKGNIGHAHFDELSVAWPLIHI